ncbi:hypothetical protein SEA_KALNOKY_89 [Mycobacterium phage Kalnoky]|uniref:Uncharacterized protein n=1 Tax=Mycobacterium phage PurpleHaze TaxID=1983577 RepID=A0A220NRY1_9CAUD|nr:hypothetical protein KIJ57_gp10 [Mycobacterium phage Purple Haze]AXC35186.1 hypothetical protein SEA_PHRANNY_81 [Mycobacterium phage Phranny]AXH44135.1 hypothetical protein SEA_KALNOKY_89 [Mycobacterium phage Kalnoky]AXH44543.1 hypothetical protein SEA_MARIUS_89 [Mycobacterium phage Marius]AXH44713.1 hypothetical protein SEA_PHISHRPHRIENDS_85 [Mycobacterium phage PhishRPhriends]AXH44860.1 hypothetical protein SEA_REBA_84 [Mycobacterium phage Reba]AZF96857.1 hypothetical protein SEA_KALB97_
MDTNRLKLAFARLLVAGAAVGAMVLGDQVEGTDSARIKGDDNGDGIVMEDESGWDCRAMSNQICGPANDQGVTPGRYEAGVLVEAWDAMLVRCDGSDLCLGA